MKDELQSIISGKSKVRHGTIIQAATCYLKGGQGAGKVVKGEKYFKKQEEQVLKAFIEAGSLWFKEINFKHYLSEGAEQRVFLEEGRIVLKLNDSIFYESWEDYFNSLLLHNYFFPDTAYELKGFTHEKEVLYAVVEQPFVKASDRTNLNHVGKFMQDNGFLNKKNNDYFNPELGIILEDLHEENVLTKDGLLYFVDTVFYLTEEFFTKT